MYVRNGVPSQTLGAYPAVYATWVDQVKRDGGRVSALPDLGVVAIYPATVWVPKVNAKVWPIAPRFGPAVVDGVKREGYNAIYPAPAAVQTAAKSLTSLTTRESVSATVRDVGTVLKQTAQDVAALPRQAVGAVLGVPPWVVPVALGVGLFFVGRAVLPVLGGVVESHLKKR